MNVLTTPGLVVAGILIAPPFADKRSHANMVCEAVLDQVDNLEPIMGFIIQGRYVIDFLLSWLNGTFAVYPTVRLLYKRWRVQLVKKTFSVWSFEV